MAELAETYGLEEDFVIQVIDAMSGPQRSARHSDLVWKALLKGGQQFFDAAKNLWLNSTANPIGFVVATGLAGYLLQTAVNLFQAMTGAHDQADGPSAIVWAVLGLHLACFARHGRMRFPAMSSGIMAGALLAGALLRTGRISVFDVGFAVSSGLLYFVFGALMTLMGGYIAAGRQARNLSGLSRQEALDRRFAIKERLKKLGPLRAHQSDRRRFDALKSGSRWILLALCGGALAGLFRVLVLGGYQVAFPGSDLTRDPVYALLRIIAAGATVLAFLFVGFIAGGVRRSLASQVLAFLGFAAAGFFPLGIFGFQFGVRQFAPEQLPSYGMLLAMSGILTGIGSHIEESARLQRRRDSDDPATLVAELVLIEKHLNRDASANFVLCLDVARSTAMKAGQDPLEVEWSFRELQRLWSESAEANGGSVLSTAGDGAILTFSDAYDALRAAKDAQTRLGWFNMRVNRLEAPFRVRAGLHTGEAQGALGEVQYNDVIDIAAHFQEHAPVGGILVSETFARLVSEEPLTELKDPVDGLKAFLVVNPTLGA